MVRKGFTKDRRGRLVRAVEATPVLDEPLEEVVDQTLDLDTLSFNELKAPSPDLPILEPTEDEEE